MGDVEAGVAPAVLIVAGVNGSLLVIAAAGMEDGALIAAGEGDVRIGGVGGAADQVVLPVGRSGGVPEHQVGGVQGGGLDAVVMEGFFSHGQVLLLIEEIDGFGDIAGGLVNGGFGRSGPCPALFGGDQHHAASAPTAVDGGGIGVFEDFDALDIQGVDIRQGALAGVGKGARRANGGIGKGNAVDQEERLAALRDAVLAADADIEARAGVAVGRGNGHSGDLAGQGGQGVAEGLAFDVCLFHRDDAAGVVAPGGGAVGDHLDFVQGVFIGVEGDEQVSGVSGVVRECFGFKANIGDLQDPFRGNPGEAEGSIRAGLGGASNLPDGDGSPGKRLVPGIGDLAGKD